MPLYKRSVRLGINLTPDQDQQLKLAAQQVQQTPARHAYELLCAALENPFRTVPSRSITPEQGEQLADLYGLLDVLAEGLDENREASQSALATPELLLLLQQVHQGLNQLQQALSLSNVEKPHPWP